MAPFSLSGHYEGSNHHGDPVILDSTKQLAAGEKVNLTPEIASNAAYFSSGPGYSAKE
jgi:hypothetical protein